MRYLFIILSILFLSFMCDNEPVKLLEATSESWTGGARGSGRGINYRLTVVVNKSDQNLTFDTLWVGKRAFAVQASKPHPFTAKDGFDKMDTVIIYASLMQAANRDGDLLPLPDPGPGAPVEYEGEGLLSFSVRNKVYYLIVPSFEVLTSIEYP